jgi:8-oxo-dGTP pyrophosphatase MutT (NUDIX family)
MVKRFAFKAASLLLLQPLYRQMRGITLGTRTAVFGEDGQVLLVRHTYAPGWMFPGGGVERGETIYAAASRELREEAGIVAGEEPALHGLFLNDRQFPGDHVACFVVRRFSGQASPNSLEIAEARFCPLDALPEETTGGTRRRLAEIISGAAIAREW